MNWVLIIIAALVLLIILVKIKEVRHHFFYKLIGLIAVLFGASVVYIFLKSGETLATYEGFLSFGKTYSSWLGDLLGNAKGITGYAVQQDWGFNSSIAP